MKEKKEKTGNKGDPEVGDISDILNIGKSKSDAIVDKVFDTIMNNDSMSKALIQIAGHLCTGEYTYREILYAGIITGRMLERNNQIGIVLSMVRGD